MKATKFAMAPTTVDFKTLTELFAVMMRLFDSIEDGNNKVLDAGNALESGYIIKIEFTELDKDGNELPDPEYDDNDMPTDLSLFPERS